MNNTQFSPLGFGINYSDAVCKLKTLKSTIEKIADDPGISKRIGEIEAKGIGINIHTTPTTPTPAGSNRYLVQASVGWEGFSPSKLKPECYNPDMKPPTRERFAERLLKKIIEEGEKMASRLKIVKPKDAPAPKPIKAKEAQIPSPPITTRKSQDNKPTTPVSEKPDELKKFEENLRKELNNWQFEKDKQAAGLFDVLQDFF